MAWARHVNADQFPVEFRNFQIRLSDVRREEGPLPLVSIIDSSRNRVPAGR